MTAANDKKMEDFLSEIEAKREELLKRTSSRKITSNPFKLPEIFNYDLKNDFGPEKRWHRKEADVTDYFNYGFNEESWILYTNKVKTLGNKLNANDYKAEVAEEKTIMKDNVPLDLGGFSAPFFKDLFTDVISSSNIAWC